MFSEESDYKLTSERRGIEEPRVFNKVDMARTGQTINHSDLQFRPLGIVEQKLRKSHHSSQEKISPERLDGRWLPDWD